MEYFDYLLGLFYDGLENFFKSFTIVSGKATLRVLYFSVFYLFLTVIMALTKHFTFLDIPSAVLAVILVIIINCISTIQKNDIEKFKKLLKGDEDIDDKE